MTNNNDIAGYDSFEIQLHYEASIIKETLKEKKAELLAKSKNPHLFFGVAEFCKFNNEFTQLQQNLDELLKIPLAKEVIYINDRYQPIKNCLARINPQ